MSLVTRLARRRGFQCLHKYVVPEWTDSANSSVFGACFTPHGHGHNYELEIYIEGPMDPVTGMILNLTEVDLILKEAVQPLEGKQINLEVPALSGQVPTTERLAHYLMNRLQAQFVSPVRLVKIRLFEYENLWVDLWAN
jgi:6-pyruvoyltetrahydropterin/6-carboxytetrahydropterin synthase